MKLVTMQKINWRESLLSMEVGQTYERKNATVKEIGAIRMQAHRLKKSRVAEYTVCITDTSVVVKRIS